MTVLSGAAVCLSLLEPNEDTNIRLSALSTNSTQGYIPVIDAGGITEAGI